ncbi:MAG: hypothetical protein AAGB93_04495 [Planctomycetota bacterium]
MLLPSRSLAALLLLGGVTLDTARSQNDECASALPISSGSHPFDTRAATPSPEPWPCAASGGPDLWFEYTAASTNPVRFNTCVDAFYDSALELFEGTCGSGTSIDCDSAACGLGAVVTAHPSAAGDVFLVRVGGYGGAAGPGTLTVTELAPVANDECATPSPIGLGVTPFSNAGSTASAAPWPCLPPTFLRPDTWYEFVAVSGRPVRVDVTTTGSFTAVSATTGPCGAQVPLGCVLSGSGPNESQALVFQPSGPGEVISIRIGDLVFEDGVGTIRVEELDPTTNDECSAPAPLVPDVPTPFATFTASPSPGTYGCAMGVGPDVWFSYVATDPNVSLLVETCGSSLNTVLEAYEGPCDALVPIACSDDQVFCGGSLQSRLRVLDPVPGTTYTFRVGGAFGEIGDGEIVLREEPPAALGCVVNPGFETGDLAGWTVSDFANPVIPALATTAGFDPGFGFAPTAPTEGVFSVVHGFDAIGPDSLVLSQVVTVDPSLTPLTFDWRAAWDMQSIPGSTLDRTFDVVVRDETTGAELSRERLLTAGAGTQNPGTGTARAIVDLAAYLGQTVRVELEWYVPEAFTGPAIFELDNVLCPAQGGDIGTAYCAPAATNSTGVPGHVRAFGSPVASDGILSLFASDLPARSFGFFLVSRTQDVVAQPGGSVGTLCLGGDVGRYVAPGQVANSGPDGTLQLSLDLSNVPQSTGGVQVSAGDTWNFQAWYRDARNGVPVSNLTGATSVDFQ